jgi:DNA-binding LytR/AlgR family response regulator
VVRVPPQALPLERPLTVRIAALASSEVLWNGRSIGRNGMPGEDRRSERPGQYFATFTIPRALVRPGANLVSVRMSSQHLWLPALWPVHILEIGLYETPVLPGRSHYLPALLALGAIATAFVFFCVAACGRSPLRERGAPLLAGVAGAALLQLLIEVSRAFVAYSYPWHLARVSAIAVMAAITAVLVAAYATGRFNLGLSHKRRLVAATAILTITSLVFVPSFDLKAMAAILTGALALGLAALHGMRRGLAGATWAVAAGLAIILAMRWQLTAFLDQAYYLLLAVVLVALVAEQMSSLRRARAERDEEARRAAALAERLARAERAGEPIVTLKDGSRRHRVAESDILYVRAADDYCDVMLKDGRSLLVTMSLARLTATLPARFVRVHKSYAVNRAHVTSVVPRAGGARSLALGDG